MESKKEIIQIHIGHAGIQIGDPCWDIYRQEHEIDSNGFVDVDNFDNNAFFSCDENGKVTTRSILIDTENSAVDVFRKGPHKDIFDPKSLISDKMDAGGLYTNGYYTKRSNIMHQFIKALRFHAEQCSNLQGFIIYRALGGGTGSGFGTKLLENLNDCFPKRSKIEFNIFPSPNISSSMVEPVNTILSTSSCMDLSNYCFLLENECFYQIASEKLDIDSPTFKHLNQIIAQVIANFTSFLRFDFPIKYRLCDLENLLIPIPNLRYPMINYAPLLSIPRASPDKITPSVLTNSLFEPNNQLINCNPMMGKCLSSIFLYRGNMTPSYAIDLIDIIKSKLSNIFIENDINKLIKYSIGYVEPTKPKWKLNILKAPTSVCLLANNTCIRSVWLRILQQFSKMEVKRAYFHHFLSKNFNDNEFLLAKNNLCSLVNEYKNVEK